MTLSPPHKSKLAERTYVLLCLLFCVFHAAVTVGWIVSPGMNEYREWAQADAVLRLFRPGGPYAGPDSDGIYLYGFLFPLLGRGWHALWGGDLLPSLRALSYALTLAAAGLSAHIIYARSRRAWAAALGFSLLLVADWQNVTGTATPASLGTLLLLAALWAAPRGSLLPAVLTVALFYVKPYFVAVFLPLLLFYGLTNRRRAAAYLTEVAALAALSVAAVRWWFPYYYVYNVVHHVAAASSDVAHLLRQLAWSAVFFFPLVVLLAVRMRRERKADAFALSALCLFLAWLRLGLHTGAYMSYVFHLWLPPLVVAALSGAPPLSAPRRTAFAAVCLGCSLLLPAAVLTLPLPPAPSERAAWRSTLQAVAACPADSTLNLSPLTACVRVGLCPDNGQGQYVSTLYQPRPWLLRLFPEQADLQARATGFENALQAAIDCGSYPVVVADSHSLVTERQLRGAGYLPVRSRRLRVGLHTFGVCIWRRTTSHYSKTSSK